MQFLSTFLDLPNGVFEISGCEHLLVSDRSEYKMHLDILLPLRTLL
jgi:hypothetical protein